MNENVTPQKAYLESVSTLTLLPGTKKLQISVTIPREGLYRFIKIRPIAADEMILGITNAFLVNLHPRGFLDKTSATRSVNGT